MRRWIFAFALGLIVSCWLPTGYERVLSAEQPASEGSAPKSAKTDVAGPVVCVQTIPLGQGKITERIDVYGSVIAAPGALMTVSSPYKSHVLGIMVNEGQKVSKGDILLKIQPSPDTLLQLNQAKNAYDLAEQSYRQMETRHDLKLATNSQLIQARQALDQAKLQLESMRNRGIDGEKELPADVAGLIKKVYVQEGSIVPAGNPIIDIVEQNRVEVLLGVEPEDIERVQTGQSVSLTRVNAPASSKETGQVLKISYAVNASTRLVDVFVSLPSPAGFLLGEFIEGKIILTAAEGLIVPRSAVLPEGDRHVLFTVKDGRAVKHTVEIRIENDREYQILGKDLRAGDDVVVLGNYELTDGMVIATGPCR